LLHGFAGSWRSFEPLLAHLPSSIHAFVPTQRGHGEASKPADGYGMCEFAGDVVAFMDALELEAACVGGHSMGASVALRCAVDHPARTRGLILVGACVAHAGDAKVRAFWESTVSKLADPIDPAFVRGFLESTVARPVSQALFDQVLRDSLKVPARVWKAAWRNRLEGEAAVDLDQVRCPTLVVWGDQDERCLEADQETLLTAIADARLVVYPGAGHAVHAEKPGPCAMDVAHFVEAVEARRSA
jgi:pimeloyl-ACP methyl ester carboxylesterase